MKTILFTLIVFLSLAVSGQEKDSSGIDYKVFNSNQEEIIISPPLIPHTTAGFFPIKRNRNVCLECHMPDKAEEVDAVPIPEAHLSDQRPELIYANGVYRNPPDEIKVKKLNHLNYAYFNCSQCHIPEQEIEVDISDLITPELRKKFNLPKIESSKE